MTSSVNSLSLIFHIHQPNKLRPYRFFEIGNNADYFDQKANETYVRHIAQNCYLPATKILLQTISRKKGKFKLAIAVSGIAIDQFERFVPELIERLRILFLTGHVEFLPQTYAHSLVWLKSEVLFKEQLEKHASKIESLFGQRPAKNKYFDYMLRSTNEPQRDLMTIISKLRTSCIMGQPFSLCVDLRMIAEELVAINSFSDLFSKFIHQLVADKRFVFSIPSAFIELLQPDCGYKELSFTKETDYSAWLGNEMQQEAFTKLYQLENKMKHCTDPALLNDWESLQSSDYFYDMNINCNFNNEIQKYTNRPYSPYDTFINYMNVLSDFALRPEKRTEKARTNQ